MDKQDRALLEQAVATHTAKQALDAEWASTTRQLYHALKRAGGAVYFAGHLVELDEKTATCTVRVVPAVLQEVTE